MLGRQQIAGIPTAISELFKNAHDAYADHVEVDYFRSEGLFVLRDDGIGMTRDEFEGRWLTIGTESKLNSRSMPPPPPDPDKRPRPLLGEKGIGRLAIAVIGPQVLVLTRATRGDDRHPLVAAYMHWGLFECPGVDLDDIEIPIREFEPGTLPGGDNVRDMVSEFAENLDRLGSYMGEDRLGQIRQDIERFQVDPQVIDGDLGAPSLGGNGRGTHFLIMPASDLLEDDIDAETTARASPLQKSLLGFTNTMTPDHEEPVIRCAFRDYRTDDAHNDLIGENEFFTPDEFLNADHHFVGEFDEYGQFRGKVSIYGEEDEYSVTWPKARGIPTKCGPFRFRLAEVMGNQSETTVPFDEYARMVSKMRRIGGLYVYREGIRILPYGDTDFDWLDIEFNRSKGAGYYHFSYRRMFGVVEITNERNAALHEKAGREGFRENQAYRQFRDILKNFLLKVAADFFREGGARAEDFEARKAELKRLDKARKTREKQVTARKAKLVEELQTFFRDCDAGTPQQEAINLSEEAERDLERILQLEDQARAAEGLLELEADSRRKLAELQDRYRIAKPRIGLSQSVLRDWDNYCREIDGLEQKVFAPARSLIENLIGDRARQARIELDRRLRIERSLEELEKEARRATRHERTETRRALDTVTDEVHAATRDSMREVDDVIKDVSGALQRTDFSALQDAELVSQRGELEQKIILIKEQTAAFLQFVRNQLEAVDCSRDGVSQLDQLEALEQRAVALEEQAETDLQLTQLGMAIEIINHEFESNVRSIRDNLRRLKAWADVNADMEQLYNNIRAGFDHLDGYLTLFTPLHRRLYRKEVVFSGADIAKFLSDLFGERFRRHSIDLQATSAFKHRQITGYPSSFYPVFVNLIDNAVFWLEDRSDRRTITLDADGNDLLVRDNGPGVAERDREAIFELGFTRKPAGRGMGLHISREVMAKIGWQLTLDPTAPGEGAVFRLHPESAEGEQE